MKTFNSIESEINNAFNDFLDDTLRLKDDELKYFYWSLDFFKNIGNLSFSLFSLTLEEKKEINSIGEKYFESEKVLFIVNKKSHRHDLKIKGADQSAFGNHWIKRQP